MKKVITVVNQKGGVGKTTIACHLAFAASEAGERVLVIDMDTQGNTSQVLTGDMNIQRRRGGAETLFEGGELGISETHLEGVDLLHGHAYLEELDLDPGTMTRALALRTEVRRLHYDRILLDTPPSLGPRQAAPMMWADKLVVPVEPTQMSMSGLPALLTTVQSIKKVNHHLVVNVVANRIHATSKEQRLNVEALRATFGRNLIAELANRSAVADLLAAGRPVWAAGRKEVKEPWLNFVRSALELE